MSGSQTVRLVNLLVRAVRTAPPQRPVTDGGLPLMAKLAPPPDLFVAASGDILRPQIPVLGRVPLGGELRMCDGQRILSGADSFAVVST
jgi:hypothetical protein